jgi:Ca2+-binding EF-hand superfamily protein
MARRRLFPAVLALASSVFGLPAAGGGIDNNAIFVAADLDLSGDLSLGEFTTTLSTGLSANAALRKFKAADRNLNGSVQLNEFLVFTGSIPPPSKAEIQFEIIDDNANGSLTFEEFTANAKPRLSIVKLRRDFLRADLDADGSVTLAEYISFKSGAFDHSFISIFTLADLDEDDEVDPIEFGYSFPRGTSEAKIMARFQAKDDNDDGVLTRAEWNPGVRGGLSL